MKGYLRVGLALCFVLAMILFCALFGLAGIREQARPTPTLSVVRPVCTDNVCGGCDGLCHDAAGVENDHVSVRKNGHCACTPRPGGGLDRAIREAYQRWTREARRQ